MNTLDENVAILRKRHAEQVARLKIELASWIEQQSGPSSSPHLAEAEFATEYYTEIFTAPLETAIDRHIKLLGAEDAFDLIKRAFQRRKSASPLALSGNARF